jgi:hypothetical protein
LSDSVVQVPWDRGGTRDPVLNWIVRQTFRLAIFLPQLSTTVRACNLDVVIASFQSNQAIRPAPGCSNWPNSFGALSLRELPKHIRFTQEFKFSAAALVCATCFSLSVANGYGAGPAITVFRY